MVMLLSNKNFKYFAFPLFIGALFFPKDVFGASLGFEPTSISVKSGQQFDLKVNLDNPDKQKTLGVDLVVKFDPKILKAVKVSETKLYPNYFPNEEARIKDGEVVLSGTSEMTQPVDGQGQMAAITFKAVRSGKTAVGFDWKADATNDTNIVSSEVDQDLLTSQPQPAQIEVKSGSLWDWLKSLLGL